MKELGGEMGVLVGLDLPLADWRMGAGVRSHIGASESEEKQLRL